MPNRRSRYRMDQGFGQPFTMNRESPQARGLVAWWPTLGSRGTNVLRDMAGGPSSAILGAGVSWVADARHGTALRSDEPGNGRIVVGDFDRFEPANITLSVWRKPDIQNRALDGGLAKGTLFGGPENASYSLDFHSGNSRWAISDGTDTFHFCNVAIPDTDWHLWTATFDGAVMRQYLDGVEKNSTVAVVAIDYTKSENRLIILGNLAGGFNPLGLFGDMRMYNIAQTPSEVWQYFSKPWDLYRTPELAWAQSLGTTYFQSIAGAFQPSGALTKETQKPLAGAFTPSGVIVKETRKPLAGVFTAGGVLVRKALKPLVGAWSGSGVVSKKTAKPLTGDFTPTGTVTKKTFRALVGVWSGSGTIATARRYFRSFAGTFTSSGVVTKKTKKVLTGSLASIGTIAKKTKKVLAGVMSWLGSLVGISSNITSVPLTLLSRTSTVTIQARSFTLTLGEKP